MPSPPKTLNYHPLLRSVARALRQRCRVQGGASIVVGCSGGADSVALLRALAMLADRRQWGLRLIVGHVQHHLRGEEAERDAAFVSQLAAGLGLGFERRDIYPDKQPGNLEANARKLRYQALADIACARDAGFVATAHHADDQLETVLMRMLRGSGALGLRGIAWRRRLRTESPKAKVYAIRPMLGCERDDALDLLNQLDQPWREDATNKDTTRTRARLRHQVIPLLKAIRADAPDKAVALADHMDDLHQLVQEHVEAIPVSDTLDAMPRSKARALNPIVLTQVLRRDLLQAGVRPDRIPGHALHPVVEAVNDGVGGQRSFDFAGGVTIEVSSNSLRVVKLKNAEGSA